MSTAAPPYLGRSAAARYRLAAAVTALVVGVLVVSSFLDYSTLRGIPANGGVLGLPAVALVALATYLGLRGFERTGGSRRRNLTAAGIVFGLALLLWLFVINLFVFSREAGAMVVFVCAIACLPTTAFGLWLIKRLDMNEKEPWQLVLVAAAWGALVATSLVISVESFWDNVSFRVLVPGPGLEASIALSAGLFEELAKGVAILLLFLVMRNQFDDVVDGIVYGAAVGFGFNFLESISYMTYLYAVFQHGEGAFAAAFQWYARQVLGLFFGHATYAALTGAGFGIARQCANRWQAVTAIVCGWLIAIAAHFSWDAWLAFFPISRSALALIEIHLRTLLMSGPFTAAVVALLVLGLEREGRAIRQQLEEEASLGRGAVLPIEVHVLSGPWRRFRARLSVLAHSGFRAYGRLARLQQAQIRLAVERWHRARLESDLPPDAEDELRARIVALRAELIPRNRR